MGEIFRTFHFKIDEREVSIKLKEISPGYLEIPIIRPTNPYEAGYSGGLKERDFLNDIKSLVPKSIEGKNISEEFNNCLFNTIMNHAEKHGRVLPDDGRSYIAESVLLLHATFKEFHNIEYGPRELNDIYRATEQSLFDRLDKQS